MCIFNLFQYSISENKNKYKVRMFRSMLKKLIFYVNFTILPFLQVQIGIKCSFYQALTLLQLTSSLCL